MNANTTRYPFIAVLGLVAFALVACTGADAASDNSGDAGRVSVAAPIESVDVVAKESAPGSYVVRIVSGQPSGCAAFEDAAVTGRDGNLITVVVTNTMPSDPETICTMIFRTHTAKVDLGSDFTPGGTYTVDVNGTTVEFTA